MLYTQAKEKGIGGIDIKTEIILNEDGYIEKIIAAVPCRNDEEYKKVYDSIETWDTLVEKGNLPFLLDTEIILNGTGNYVTHGPIADCGVTGRKLVVDFYGGELHVGGGSPWTKDGSKADLTLNLFARAMAIKYARERNQPVKVSVACCIGRSEIDYVVETTCGEEITDGKMNVTPKELIKQYDLNKPIFASMCKFGLFGKYQQDKKWER